MAPPGGGQEGQLPLLRFEEAPCVVHLTETFIKIYDALVQEGHYIAYNEIFLDSLRCDWERRPSLDSRLNEPEAL